MNLFELTKNLINIPSISEDEQPSDFFSRDFLEFSAGKLICSRFGKINTTFHRPVK